MNTLTPSQAFGVAPPRRPAVLCVKGPDGSTDMITTQWFNWLNFKRNPMIAYAMETTAGLGLNVDEGSEVWLAFPPVREAARFRAGIRTAAAGKEKQLPPGIEAVTVPGVPVLAPARSEAVLHCTIAGHYKYPFKKVRIFNCNLEEALGDTGEITVANDEE